jgi:hypothetical protein
MQRNGRARQGRNDRRRSPASTPEHKGRAKTYGGWLTSSGRHCILASAYKSTGPWRGRQILFDIEEHRLNEFPMPRSCAACRLVDHAGDWLWAERAFQGEARRITRLSVSCCLLNSRPELANVSGRVSEVPTCHLVGFVARSSIPHLELTQCADSWQPYWAWP